MNRRSFFGISLFTSLLSGCLWRKNFDLEWEEEVLLHDGRVIVVKIKHTYERLRPGITRYGGQNIPRDTTLTFDAGGSTGTVTQLFKGYQPMFLGQHEGVWYVTIAGGDYYRSKEIPGQNWGLHWYDCSPAAKLVGARFEPISIHDLPALFEKPNLLLLYGTAEEHAAFDGGRVTLAKKLEWVQKHPPGYGHNLICRPPKVAKKPANLFRNDRAENPQR
jgi:hypothetical protein